MSFQEASQSPAKAAEYTLQGFEVEGLGFRLPGGARLEGLGSVEVHFCKV